MKKKFVLMPVVIFMMFLFSFECYGQSPSNSSVKNCKLTFIARPPNLVVRTKKQFSPAGHTYVKLTADITWKASGNKWRMDKEMGFYKDGAKGGKIKYETIHSGVVDVSYTISITPDQYYRIISLAKQWNNTNYTIGTYDCVTFVKEVARLVKLRVPKRIVNATPTIYVKSLKRLN